MGEHALSPTAQMLNLYCSSVRPRALDVRLPPRRLPKRPLEQRGQDTRGLAYLGGDDSMLAVSPHLQNGAASNASKVTGLV